MPSPGGTFFRTVDGKLNDMSVLICNAHGELHGAWLHVQDTLHLYRLDLATDEQARELLAAFGSDDPDLLDVVLGHPGCRCEYPAAEHCS